jgi:hypothetical protein
MPRERARVDSESRLFLVVPSKHRLKIYNVTEKACELLLRMVR